MYFRKYILCFVAFVAFCCGLHAEVLKGRVVDAETKEPLEGVRVKIVEVVPDFCTISREIATDSAGYFHHSASAGNILTITAKFFGYHDAKVKRLGVGGSDTIRIDDILLKPSDELMRELTVTAKVKRFYMKGDTVVFNPEAFNVESGDRLIALVEKLPGVSFKDGKLLWNGEPLKIMMNGKDALSEDMFLNRLPVEAVDKVKAYERTSELQDRTGVADGNQEHVLDVTLKPGFMEKFQTTAEAKAYTGKEYAAGLDAMKLSDKNPIMLFGRVADDPTVQRMKTMSASGSSSGLMPVRQQMGALAYRHLWQPKYEIKRDSRWDITAGINHIDDRFEGWENNRVFLPETTPTLSQSTSRDYNHNLTVPLDFSSFLNVGQQNTLWLSANVSYVREHQERDREQETSEDVEGFAPINSFTYHSLEKQESLNMRAGADFTHYITGGSLAVEMGAEYKSTESEGTSLAEYRYFQQGRTTADEQRFSAPSHNFKATGAVDFKKAIGKDVMTRARWETTYANRYRDEQRWRNDALDTENSTYRKDNDWVNKFLMNANCKMGAFNLKPSLEMTHRHEQSTYRRAALDTLARRNLFLVRPQVEMHYKFKRQMGLKGTLAYNNTPADMIDCIGYVDNTNPLYILQGNPNLKTSHTLNASLLYNMMLMKHSQSLSVKLDYQKAYNPIGTVMHYNSNTGAYRVQKRNVRGGDRWSMRAAYDRDLTDDLRLRNTIEGSYNRTYGIMTLVDEQTGMTYNRQSESSLKEDLELTYEHGPWYASMRHRFTWRHYAYSDASQLASDIYNYIAELHGSYELKNWKFSLMPRYVLDRGYSSHLMNGGQFLLNAQVSFTFLKKRAELVLYGQDLLGQQKIYDSSITATSHSESGEKILHQYASLTFRYRFDPKTSKK